MIDSSPPSSLYDLGFAEIENELGAAKVSAHHAKGLWRALYFHDELEPASQFSPPLRRWLESAVGEGKRFFLDVPEVVAESHSSDLLTRKYLLRLRDGQCVETVLMGYDGRYTACVSTQVGCAMGCVFCATGQMGFVRHLRAGEIIAQVLHARRVLRATQPQRSLRNLVLMGMGEPLHNYAAVMQALEVIASVRGINIGPSKISISTVGVVPGILRMAAESRPYRLAVSLHGSTEAERAALVPAGKRWGLGELIEACRTYGRLTGKRIFIEWTLVAGSNDSLETAARLAELLSGMDVHINLIPLNPTSGFGGVPSTAGHAFQRVLRAAGFPCTFRQRRGIDVTAGCGQLQAAKPLAEVTQEVRSGELDGLLEDWRHRLDD
ncbi:MAG: 23S rRNA (adenine(2503)-C(2))-methyltransferase RlmN [Verrucomicrobiota bacterium]